VVLIVAFSYIVDGRKGICKCHFYIFRKVGRNFSKLSSIGMQNDQITKSNIYVLLSNVYIIRVARETIYEILFRKHKYGRIHKACIQFHTFHCNLNNTQYRITIIALLT